MLLVLLFAAAIALWEDTDENILVLTDDNFDDMIKANPSCLVEFYAPWCGHCQAFAPEYAKVAAQLVTEMPEVKVGRIDATSQFKSAQRFAIQAYPTLILFHNGTTETYDGDHDAMSVVAWLEEKQNSSG